MPYVLDYEYIFTFVWLLLGFCSYYSLFVIFFLPLSFKLRNNVVILIDEALTSTYSIFSCQPWKWHFSSCNCCWNQIFEWKCNFWTDDRNIRKVKIGDISVVKMNYCYNIFYDFFFFLIIRQIRNYMKIAFKLYRLNKQAFAYHQQILQVYYSALECRG